MLEASHLKPKDYRAQPWKNGQGETREIAADGSDPFRWRLSWAGLPASGPFSSYVGYDRILTLLKGGPVTLTHDAKKKRELRPLIAYPFKGEWKTEAAVQAPAEDFNVFALEGKARAGVYPTFLGRAEDLQFPIAGQEHFIFCVEGTMAVKEPNTASEYTLGPGETFRLSRTSTKEFLNIKASGCSEKAVCLWIVIHLT